jgi:di/tricarboxylate transporter
MSPLAPTGIIADRLMARDLDLSGFEVRLYLYNLAANAAVGIVGYLLFGGWRLFGRKDSVGQSTGVGSLLRDSTQPSGKSLSAKDSRPLLLSSPVPAPWTWQHSATTSVIGLLVAGVLLLKMDIGMGAFAAAVVLTLIGAADERKAIERIPWGVILMVCGVTVLTSLLNKTGGLDRFAELVSRVSTPRTAPGVIALASGILSVYSSTSGVVLPAILPAIPKLIAQLGGGDPLAIASSVVITGHVVDSSPLSTIGALCIASAPDIENRQTLFNQMLAWGLAMAAVGAAICFAFFH